MSMTRRAKVCAFRVAIAWSDGRKWLVFVEIEWYARVCASYARVARW